MSKLRKNIEIERAEEEFFDKLWFIRHTYLKSLVESGQEKVDKKIWKEALKAEKEVIEQYGINNLTPKNDYEYGVICGKLSALRWVLGDEWDNLST